MKHIKNLTLRAILAAVICVIAPLSFPVGAVPVTAATLIIFIVSACMDMRFSVPAVLLYIALGAVGLPVFSGFSGGFQILSGATGGFIIGYIPCAAVISFMCSRYPRKKFIYPLSMALGTVICYLFGILWFFYISDTTFLGAGTVILPFIVGDAVKIAVACAVSIPLKSKLRFHYYK